MNSEHCPFKQLMGRQSYLGSRFFHFNELDPIFMDWAIMFTITHTNHSIHTVGLELITTDFTQRALNALRGSPHIDKLITRSCLSFPNQGNHCHRIHSTKQTAIRVSSWNKRTRSFSFSVLSPYAPQKSLNTAPRLLKNSESDMRLFLAPICYFPLIQSFE
jgi:hypothetical protein